MKRIIVTLATLFITITASASSTTLFNKYEAVRQSLLKNSFAGVQTSAKALAATARAEKQIKIADRAAAVAAAASLKAARDSFSALSDEVIKFRDAQSGERPVVVYCSMHKASWLQAKGPITNPYADGAAMRSCGEVRSDR